VSDGIPQGGVGTFIREGVPAQAVGSNGTALVFDGLDDCVAFPGKTGAEGELRFAGTSPFTVFVRLRFDHLDGIQHVFSRWHNGHSLFLQRRLSFAVRATDPRRLIGSSIDVAPNHWYDVACVYRGPGKNNVRIYLHDSASGEFLDSAESTLDTAIDARTPALFLGSMGTAHFFCGAIESVLVFAEALPERDVHALSSVEPWVPPKREHFADQQRLSYGNPDLLVPFPGPAYMQDWDGDGRLDLVTRGAYFRDTGRVDRDGMPIFDAPARIDLPSTVLGDLDGDGDADCVVPHRSGFAWYAHETVEGQSRFVRNGDLQHPLGRAVPSPDVGEGVPRAALVDWDGDGRVDMISATRSVGLHRYLPSRGPGFQRGWADGTWYFRDMTATVFLHRNVGTPTAPLFTDGRLLTAGPLGRAIVFFDLAVPVPLDWNGDGLTDLLVGSFDRVMVFLNAGAKGRPRLDDGHLVTFAGRNTTTFERRPVFAFKGSDGLWRINVGGATVRQARQLAADDPFAFGELRLLTCRAGDVRLSNFAVPDVADWDGDGRKDLVVGTEDGFVWFLRNLDPKGGISRWDAPRLLESDGQPIRPVEQKHLQGPCEWWWAYTNPAVVDWDLDGDLDLILGHVGESYLYYENIGSRTDPKLTARGNLRCDSTDGDEADVSVCWRTRPGAGDLSGDGLPDLVGIDGERQLCWWPRYRDEAGQLTLGPPTHPVGPTGSPFIACGTVRGVGRTKLVVCDWDRDGRPDILASPSVHARSGCQLLFRSLGMADGILRMRLHNRRIQTDYSGHYTMCEPVDFDGDGVWEIISGRDSGRLYYWTLE